MFTVQDSRKCQYTVDKAENQYWTAGIFRLSGSTALKTCVFTQKHFRKPLSVCCCIHKQGPETPSLALWWYDGALLHMAWVVCTINAEQYIQYNI